MLFWFIFHPQAARKGVADTTMESASSGVAPAPRIQPRARRTLKGHTAKIYALYWALDNKWVRQSTITEQKQL